MPKEVRYLIFSNEELYQALLADLRAHSRPLPSGFLKSISLGGAERQEITLMYVSDKGSELPIRFEEQEVLRALIVYCGRRNIPLSAKATKTVEIRDGSVGLMCTLNFNNNKIAASRDKLSYQDEQTDSFKEAAKKAATAAAAAATAVNKPAAAPPKTP